MNEPADTITSNFKITKSNRQKILLKIADLINTTTNLRTLTRRILRETVLALEATHGFIALKKANTHYDIPAFQDFDSDNLEDYLVRVHFQREIPNLNKLTKSSISQSTPYGAYFHLVSDDQLIGTMWIEMSSDIVNEKDWIEFGEAIAAQSSRIIKTILYYDNQIELNQKFEEIINLGKVVDAFAPLPIIVSTLTSNLTRFINIKQCTLFLTGAENKSFSHPTIPVLDIRKPDGLRPGKKPKRSVPATLFSIPIEYGTTILGMFNIYTDEPRILTDDETRILSAYSAMSGMILYTAQKYEEQSNLNNELRYADRKHSLRAVGNYLAERMNDSVSIISILLDVMKEDGAFSTKNADDLTHLYQRLNYTNSLARRLVEIVRPPAPQLEYVRVNESLNYIVSLYERIASTQQILINPRFAGDLPELLISKSDFHLMISILFQNAIQAMPSGGLLNVTTSLIHSTDPNVENILRVNIRDTGRGFEMETPQDLINPFNITNDHKSNGVSLFTVQNIAFTYGARLTLRNGADHGASISINFPVGERL